MTLDPQEEPIATADTEGDGEEIIYAYATCAPWTVHYSEVGEDDESWVVGPVFGGPLTDEKREKLVRALGGWDYIELGER